MDVFDLTRVTRATRRSRSNVPITDPYDFNRDGGVNFRDREIALENRGTSLARLTPPPEAPAAQSRAASAAAEILSGTRRRTAYQPASAV